MDDCCVGIKNMIMISTGLSSKWTNLDFLTGYKNISDKREIEKFAKEFIDANYGIEEMVALHIC
jgi:hypothetical protein